MNAEEPSNKERTIAALDRLLILANDALGAAGGDDAEKFVEKTERYLKDLERWQQLAAAETAEGQGLSAGLDPEQTANLRSSLEQLQVLHQKLIAQAADTKQDVGERLGEVHRRAQGLKRYVDAFPGRVTIAGKRKG